MDLMKAKPCADLPIEMLERMAAIIRLLAHPHRLKAVEFLERNPEGAPVHAIREHVELPHAATSQHLNQMKRVGLVRSYRKGREVWYAINDPRALTILNCIRKQGGTS
jgi:DNA-binding transcriptional ArsR family regulator